MPGPSQSRVTVIVPPSAAGSRELLASLDRQTLPAADFEILVGDDERSPELTARLDDLARHRLNLTRVPVADSVEETLLARAAGEYVVGVPAGRSLTPTALAVLTELADSTGADLVAGLTGRVGVRPEGPQDPAGPLPGTAGRLRRRASTSAGDLAADLAGAAAEAAASVVTTLCFLDAPDTADESAAPADVAEPLAAADATWRDGVLHVTVVASGPARASVYSAATGVEWPLGEATEQGGNVTFALDPEDVPGLGPLPTGTWWPTLRTGDGPPALVEAGAARAHGATFRDRTTVSFSEGRRLGVDVGAGSQQPIRRLDPARTTVVEDSRGSLLTSPVRNIDLAPGARVTGWLRLGKMPVVAWLEDAEGTGTVLRAWVSGLAGESALHTRFGRAQYAPVGARLVIDGVGAMTVVSSAKEPAAAPAAAPEAEQQSGPTSKARRLAGRALRSVRG
jgi:hypothetical protein